MLNLVKHIFCRVSEKIRWATQAYSGTIERKLTFRIGVTEIGVRLFAGVQTYAKGYAYPLCHWMNDALQLLGEDSVLW